MLAVMMFHPLIPRGRSLYLAIALMGTLPVPLASWAQPAGPTHNLDFYLEQASEHSPMTHEIRNQSQAVLAAFILVGLLVFLQRADRVPAPAVPGAGQRRLMRKGR